MPFDYKQFMDELKFLVVAGNVPMGRIDDAVERILRVKFAAALFEYPFSDRSLLDTVGCKVNKSSGLSINMQSLLFSSLNSCQHSS